MVGPEDISHYRAHGWWLSPPILSEDVLDTLAFGIERYRIGERDRHLAVDLGGDGETEVVAQLDYLSLQINEFLDALLSCPVGEMAAALAETESVRIFHDQVVIKPPFDPSRSAKVGWHSDRAYWSSCSSQSMITAWIPLEDVPEEKGPLAVWDASHTWPETETLHSFGDQDLRTIEARFTDKGHAPQVRTLPMRRGQVSFHHCRLVHGGYPNKSSEDRIAYAIHMQDDANHYVPPAAASGRTGHINDLLCRKTADNKPDYADPETFPQLWPI
ncbi:phytanoyl-CoA dioxygenase family protein [Cognatiyoonia sp. IB215446]|uniref:phytanoyl-CoA dioxygenase family protein n=1 Tax=Cognatiyoonia sp. IB215446 TaxID=3097355 RepID=UPI002A0E05BD|nr:phytanoyl-CoA dioxygenase family protein [Cognatiyoonia sp. IB215446]MDX8348118.1 phytanoyl-CoA dioxygenase family protein [Cognatiyoonia sp. IB215446]